MSTMIAVFFSGCIFLIAVGRTDSAGSACSPAAGRVRVVTGILQNTKVLKLQNRMWATELHLALA